MFWEKRLQAVENKGKALQKERREISRGGKSMTAKELRAGRVSRKDYLSSRHAVCYHTSIYDVKDNFEVLEL